MKTLPERFCRIIIPRSFPTLSHLRLLLPRTHSGRLGGTLHSRWVDPEENFLPRDLLIGGWFPSLPCNRGSGLWSSPSPPVRGRTKCTDCTLCALVKARLPSLWRLGTGKEDRGPRCGWKKRLKLLTYGFVLGNFPSLFGIVEGL